MMRWAGRGSGVCCLAVAAAVAMSASASAAVSFGPRHDVSDLEVQSVTVGDFNRDGNPDVAATAQGSMGTLHVPEDIPGRVLVLLGNGRGGFGSPRQFDVGFRTMDLAVGDFDHDGNPDIASVAGQGPGDPAAEVSVLRGDGSGGFATPQQLAIGAEPTTVKVADFNADGRSDIATAREDGKVSVFLANSGGFAARRDYAVGSSLGSIATGRFKGGPVPDLAVTDPGGHTAWILPNHNDGSGTFGPPQRLESGSIDGVSLAGGEFNQATPGLDSPVVGYDNGGAGKVRLYEPSAGGYTGLDYGVGTTPSGIAVADFDRDGKPDVATGSQEDQGISVLLGRGSDQFNPALSFQRGVSALTMAAADFNRDGKPDIVFAQFAGISLILNGERQPPKPAADTTRPRLYRLRFSKPRFRVTKRGSMVSFRLSEPARVKSTVQRRTRRGRYIRVKGVFRKSAPKGRFRFPFHGIIGGKALRRGRYRLAVKAADPAGNHSVTGYRRFRILPKH